MLLRSLLGLILSIASLSAGSFPLWSPDTPVPSTSEMYRLNETTFSVIKERTPEKDGFNWLHGVALVFHDQRLLASFGHNSGKENTAGEMANGRYSADRGNRWESLFRINAQELPELAVSHGVYLSTPDTLFAFHGAFHGSMNSVHTRAYQLDETSGRWNPMGSIIAQGFWPMQEPQRLDNDQWAMAGLCVHGGIGKGDNPPGIAFNDGKDFLNWKLVTIPRPATLEIWGESTLIHQGGNLLCISRYRQPMALVSRSSDFGKTWTPLEKSNLPMTASKPYAGRLSTGHPYLVANCAADSMNRRYPLTIAIGAPGTLQFNRMAIIRNAIDIGPGESDPNAALAYPYAIEHDGSLYIGYSNSGGRGGNRNSAELAIVSIAELTSLEPFAP